MGFLAWIVVGLIAGWLAGQVMKGRRLRHYCRHHSRYPRRSPRGLDLWPSGNLAGRGNDRLHHRGIYV
jgi:hypothetical protein